jgi:nucleoside-triphosphatase
MEPASKNPRILLLTGNPGIGKTTVICQVAAQLRKKGAVRVSGFYTTEIREAGQRLGFRLISFHGDQTTLAHVSFDHRARVGKYGVDVAAIDYFTELAIVTAENTDLYIIDEIGKMECLSLRFENRIQQLLHSDKPILATVANKGGGLIETVKHWPGSELWEVTYANRDLLPAQVLEWLQNRLSTADKNSM